MAQLAFSLLVLIVLLGTSSNALSNTQLQTPADSDVELARAEENAKTAERNYQTIKRLSEKGSASQNHVRRADLDRKIASLELSTLRNPMRRKKNLSLKAKLILGFREEELKVIRELYHHGSASELHYRRAIAARDIAQSHLHAIESTTETLRKLQLIQIAKSKCAIAQTEHDIAKQLFETGSISQSTLDRATSNLKIAQAELESRKKSLGARAIQVRQ